MTIGSQAPKAERKKSTKNKGVVGENAPLIPTTQKSDAGFDEFNGASFSGAVFNLSTTIIGAGIMGLPACVKKLGMVPGLLAIILTAFLTEKSIEFMIRFSKAGNVASYGSLMRDAFGKYGKALVEICIIINNIGLLIIYMIIIGDVISGTSSSGIHHSGILEGWFGVHWWTGRTFVLISTTLAVFAPLVSFKRIVHSINNELEDSSQMHGVVRTSITLCSSVYLLTSFFGFLLFGEGTLDDVLANFDTDLGIPFGSVLNDAVRISYVAHLVFVFPVVFYALRVNLDGLIFSLSRPLVQDNFRFASITVSLVGVIFLGANFIPSIWDIFQFTGATGAVCVAFIFPAAITLRDRHNIASKSDKILSVFMIVLAVLSNAVAIYSDAYALIKKNNT